MNDEDFQKLAASIEQAGAIRRGEKKSSRVTKITQPAAKEIRASLGLSQDEFALLIGVSTRTVQNWEQHRREPEGAARALLRVAASHPQAVLEALHG